MTTDRLPDAERQRTHHNTLTIHTFIHTSETERKRQRECCKRMRVKSFCMPDRDFALVQCTEHTSIEIKVRNIATFKIFFKPYSYAFQNTHPFRI